MLSSSIGKILLAGACLVPLLPSWALAAKAERKCAEILVAPLKKAEKALAAAKEEPILAVAKGALEKYKSLSDDEAFLELLPPKFVVPLLLNWENPHFVEQLDAVLTHYKASRTEETEKRLTVAITKALEDKVPANSIAARAAGLTSGKKTDFYRALGDMTFDEVQFYLHGGDPLNPTPESLIGQYLKDTGAASLVRGFTRDPNQYDSANRGPNRLVIAVSVASFPEYAKYLLRPELFGVHAHALVSTNKKLFSYHHTGVEYRLPSPGYLLPQVLLKTTEAQRLRLFFDLNSYELGRGTSYGEQNRAMHPWSIPGYCSRGAYVNCTHWIGNMPLGDKKTAEIELPSGNEVVGGKGITSKVKVYKSEEPFLLRVWKTPTHASLSELLGVHEHNMRGDMASPGFVIHTLLGEALQSRVPFGVLVVADHKAPIDPNFRYTVEGAN